MRDLGFQRLFIEQLRDFYWAENQIAHSLHKMADAATSDELKNILNDHLDVTKSQVSRMEKILERLGESTEGQPGPAVKGLLQEGSQIIESFHHDGKVRDAALIIAARKIEHYEIASYGSLVALADQMEDAQTMELLNSDPQPFEAPDRSR